mmetsp:Transcript_18299/g.28530  ORF Transcript_18299/g.28530 Transcript_18299/m.28530 type:complete len:266 (+) Transcript_18299:315-1112(+)
MHPSHHVTSHILPKRIGIGSTTHTAIAIRLLFIRGRITSAHDRASVKPKHITGNFCSIGAQMCWWLGIYRGRCWLRYWNWCRCRCHVVVVVVAVFHCSLFLSQIILNIALITHKLNLSSLQLRLKRPQPLLGKLDRMSRLIGLLPLQRRLAGGRFHCLGLLLLPPELGLGVVDVRHLLFGRVGAGSCGGGCRGEFYEFGRCLLLAGFNGVLVLAEGGEAGRFLCRGLGWFLLLLLLYRCMNWYGLYHSSNGLRLRLRLFKWVGRG